MHHGVRRELTYDQPDILHQGQEVVRGKVLTDQVTSLRRTHGLGLEKRLV